MTRLEVARRCLAFSGLAAMTVMAACSAAEPTSPEPTERAALRVVNASNAPVRILVDGDEVIGNLDKWSASAVGDVATGTRQVRFVPLGEPGGEVSVSVTLGADGALVVARPVASGLSAEVVSDTGAIPAPGTSKLRVIHLAASAPAIDVWRKQPDYPSYVRMMFPFAYGASSSFVQSAPGTWFVTVTEALTAAHEPPNPPPAVLATYQLDIGPDVAETVVILDGENGPRLVRME